MGIARHSQDDQKKSGFHFKVLVAGLIALGPSKLSYITVTQTAQSMSSTKPVISLNFSSGNSESPQRNIASTSETISSEDPFIQNLSIQSLQFLKNRSWTQVPIRSMEELEAEFDAKAKELGLEKPIKSEDYIKICKSGSPVGCYGAGLDLMRQKYAMHRGHSDPNREPDPEMDSKVAQLDSKMKALYASSCIQGFGIACHNAFELFPKGEKREELESLSESLCDRGSRDYCVTLESELGRPNPDNPSDICPESDCSAGEIGDKNQLFQKVAFANCLSGASYSCLEFMDNPNLSEDDPNAGKIIDLLDGQCKQPSEKAPYGADPCGNIAVIAKNKGDLQAAVDYSVQGCDQGNENSCLRAINIASGLDSVDEDTMLNMILSYCRTTIGKGYKPSAAAEKMCASAQSDSPSSPSSIWNDYYNQLKTPNENGNVYGYSWE
jgi:hypothetical protein